MKPNCWWCCHPFEWDSLHFPYAFKSNVFYTTGHFCSWECMKAYAIEKNKLIECEFISLMRKRMEGKLHPTRRAPSRYVLQLFGGSVSIDEYRKGVPIVVKIPGEIYQEVSVSTTVHQSSSQQQVPLKEGDLKLKREKPLERTKCKLETSLGIIRKCSAAGQSGNVASKER